MTEPTQPWAHAEPYRSERAVASTGMRWLVGCLSVGLLAASLVIVLLGVEMRQQDEELEAVNAEVRAGQRDLRRKMKSLGRTQRATASVLASLQGNLDQVSDTMRKTDQE